MALGGQWNGIFYDCETLYPASNCEIQPQYTTLMTDYDAVAYDPSSFCPSGTAGIVCQPLPLPTDLNLWIADGAFVPYGDPGFGGEFENTFGARWERDVSFNPSTTYTIYAISNEGMRLSIDDATGITGVITPGNYILNSWFPHSNQLDVATIQTGVGSFDRTLTVEYFDINGNAAMSLSITTSRFSFSDSPNTASGGGGYTVIQASRWGNSSLMFNKFLNTGGGTTLRYSMMWDLVTNNTIYVEASTDGGFTWSIIDTLPGGLPRDNHPPNGTWVARTASLPGGGAVTFRFRLDTIAQGDNTNRDGMWVADISVGP
jgi:hypothetical protein